jgi:UDP-N-acetylmuramoyl-tripeptide--D-alanyl-D-alanine ligase
MRFTRHEIAGAIGARLCGQDGLVVGATIDSRDVPPGALFVPVVAQRDGHDFVRAAREAGAGAWLTSRFDPTVDDADSTENDGALVVADTTAALQSLGSYARTRIPDSVVGVTGSSGKTSTKDLIGAILLTDGPSAVSQKSFNNELGVPLTLVNAPDDARHAVIEMGARGIGHIAMLCAIARPTVGVVTNIGTAHRDLFGSAEGTAHAKGELLETLPPTGTAVLNADDVMFGILRSKPPCAVLSFSAHGLPSADMIATNIVLDSELRPSFSMRTPWGVTDVTLQARGLHQVENALAAAAAALAVGIPLSLVPQGLNTNVLSPWRMELHRLSNGAVIINDAYNANPSSMKAGLDSLAATVATRRIAVLGTMAELGADAAAFHHQVSEHMKTLGIDLVVAVDEPLYGVPVVHGVEGALNFLSAHGSPVSGDAILVKGSRVAGLEKLAEQLQQIGTVR